MAWLKQAVAAGLTAVERNGQRHEAVWVPMAEPEAGEVPLYPTGLLTLLRAAG